MKQLDRYLFREFAQTTFAALVVLLMVSLGGVFADVLGDIARGRVPAGMMLSQLGLQLVQYLPLILPLGLTLGLLLAVGRLYRDSEMPVLTSIGVGPKRLLRPLLMLVGPVVLVIGICSLWLGPWAQRTSDAMIIQANKTLMVTGLEPGRFTEMPGGGGVVYVGSMSNDGTQLSRIFVYRQDEDRIDVTTAQRGRLNVESLRERFLTLENGFRVEGPKDDGRDYRLMRYASNDLRLPEADDRVEDDPEALPTSELFTDGRPQASAQIHRRIAPPLLALAFALLAVPLARSAPRQARYGSVMLGLLAYLLCTMLMLLGTDWLGDGKVPMALGLWWLVLPALGIGAWFYFRDGRVRPGRLKARREARA